MKNLALSSDCMTYHPSLGCAPALTVIMVSVFFCVFSAFLLLHSDSYFNIILIDGLC